MGEQELDFSGIQKIFANRDQKSEQESIERRNQLKLIKNQYPKEKIELEHAKPKTTTLITPTKTGLKCEEVELIDKPEYDNMSATKIKFSKKALELSRFEKFAIVVCTVVMVTAIGIISFIGLPNNKTETPNQIPGVSTLNPDYDHGDNVPGMVAGILNPENCNLSDFTIVIRQSTPNVNQIVSVTGRELNELGVDNRIVTNKDNIAEVVSKIKETTPGRDIIVINVDGVANKDLTETVIMTNYSNDAKSADNLALAISNSNNDIYGISTEIRCGKKLSNGYRGPTSVESALQGAGHDDVVCITVAPSMACIDSDIEKNSLASSIVEGVLRLGSLDEEKRYSDSIRRVEYGDTIYGLAEKNGVSESYIRSVNSEVLSDNYGILRNDAALLVTTVPKNLTSKVSVNNPTITTNANDVSTKVLYYEVMPGDTVSEIAEKLGVSQGELVIPSGNANKIYPGDKIGYETEVGKILVAKTTGKSK